MRGHTQGLAQEVLVKGVFIIHDCMGAQAVYIAVFHLMFTEGKSVLKIEYFLELNVFYGEGKIKKKG